MKRQIICTRKEEEKWFINKLWVIQKSWTLRTRTPYISLEDSPLQDRHKSNVFCTTVQLLQFVIYNLFSIFIIQVLGTLYQIQRKCGTLHFSLCLLPPCMKENL